MIRGALWQSDLKSLMFVSDFNACAVFAVDLNHFNDPPKELARVGEQRGVPNRTSKARLRHFHDEIKSAACLGSVST